MHQKNSLNLLKNAVAELDKSFKAKEKKYITCKQNMDNMQNEVVKTLFSKEAYDLALNQCNLLISLFEKKVGLDKSMQVLERCYKSEALLYKCSGRLSNFEKKVIEIDGLNRQIDSFNKLAESSSLKEDLTNSASFLKPLCQYLSPNNPNYESAIELCGQWADDSSL
jgi:hypothetical protein